MTTKLHELKSCPFCGKQDVRLMTDYEIEREEPDDDCDANYAVCCSINKGGCGATGGYNYEPCGAIALWNQRKE